MKKDTSADVVSFIWEYMKLPEDVRNKVKSEMDEIHEHCRDSEFQKPDLYDIVSKEEVAGLEQSMQKIFADIITEVSSIACWVYVEKCYTIIRIWTAANWRNNRHVAAVCYNKKVENLCKISSSAKSYLWKEVVA